jgi:hypothetical protein
MASPNLADPIYDALRLNSPVASVLSVYEAAPAIFTRRPVPAKAKYPMIVCAGDVTRVDQDLLVDEMPRIIRDISIFGQNDTTAHYRAIESLGLMVRDLFHRKPASIIVPGWTVLDIIAQGPIVGPTDDDTTVHRLVTLTVRLSN